MKKEDKAIINRQDRRGAGKLQLRISHSDFRSGCREDKQPSQGLFRCGRKNALREEYSSPQGIRGK